MRSKKRKSEVAVVIVGQRESKSGLWLALIALFFVAACGAGFYAWSYPRGSAETKKQAVAAAEIPEKELPVPQPRPLAVASPANLDDVLVPTHELIGDGMPLNEWTKTILAVAPDSIRFETPDLPRFLSDFRISHYEGDTALPFKNALELFRYAGFATVPEGRAVAIRLATAQDAVEEYLSSPTNPDSLTWGAFKPWTRFTVSVSAVRDADIVFNTIPVPGAACLVENPDVSLISYARANEFGNDAVLIENAIQKLTPMLDAPDLETRCKAAWKLGEFDSISALEALVWCVENSTDHRLASTALIAACRVTKSMRNLKNYADTAKRNAAFHALRRWQARVAEKQSPELAPALAFATQTFAAPSANELLSNANSPLRFAAPNWRRFTMEQEDALVLLRSNDRQQIIAALWRWNRMGADRSAAVPIENGQTVMVEPMTRILASSPSANARRLALEALYRRGEKREGVEYLALMENPSLAMDCFLRDPDARVQHSAAAILSRSAGIAQINVLRQAVNPAHAPAGMELVLSGLVERFWTRGENSDEVNLALDGLIESMLTCEDALTANRAAWAKMQHPGLDIETKLRSVKSFKHGSQRVEALKALGRMTPTAGLAPKYISVFTYDNEPSVRAAVFSERLLRWIQAGPEYVKICERGMQDESAEVRNAAKVWVAARAPRP